MTTGEPIEVDKTKLECAVLVDLENLRLSWRREFNRNIQYEDLHRLCGLLEDKLNVPNKGVGGMDRQSVKIVSLSIFMSDPQEFLQVQLGTHSAQRTEHGRRHDKRTDKKSEADLSIEEREVFRQLERMHYLLKRDSARNKTKTPVPISDSPPIVDVDSDEEILVEPAPLNNYSYDIHVQSFGYKRHRGRVVQRSCDVAVGSACTKLTFLPNLDVIVLFSADSDFESSVTDCLRSETMGGVVRYAKNVLVMGFAAGFDTKRRSLARQQRLARKDGVPLQLSETGSTSCDYYCVEEEFAEELNLMAPVRVKRLPFVRLPQGKPKKQKKQVNDSDIIEEITPEELDAFFPECVEVL